MDIMGELKSGALEPSDVLDSIYEKFLRSGHAPYEVNISWRRRVKCKAVFEGKSVEETSEEDLLLSKIEVVGEAAKEIAYLLNGSFSRFRRTDVCKELWEKNCLANSKPTVIASRDGIEDDEKV